MSLKTGTGRTSAIFEKGKTKLVRFNDFMNGLSVKNKANFDVQLKSDKSFSPLFKHSFGYNKEFKLKHILMVLAAVAAVAAVFSAFKSKD